MAAHDRILLQQHHPGTRNNLPLALVRIDQAGEAFEQGRLASAVAADQRQPVARPDENVEIAEEPAFTLDQSKAFI
jgi:hypothetical protein